MKRGVGRAQAVSERSISFMVSLCDLEESAPPIGNPNRARSFRERSLESDQRSWHPKFGLLAITASRSRSGKGVRKSRIPNRDDTKARNCQPNPKNPMRIKIIAACCRFIGTSGGAAVVRRRGLMTCLGWFLM